MPRLTKRELEQYYFELFKNAYTLPAGEIFHDDKPDFIITGARKLGIEMTHFYLEDGDSISSEPRQHERRESAVAMAQSLYMKNGGKNVQFRFGFDKAHPIQDLKAVAKSIAALAPLVEDRANGRVPRSQYEHIPELDFMYLYARQLQYDDEADSEFPNGEPDFAEDPTAWTLYRNRRDERARRKGIYKPLPFDAEWGLTQSHSFGLMSTQRLEEIVAEKEKKARDYKPCEAYWLLVIVEFIDPGQEQEIRVDGVTLNSEVFERVIIYKPHFEHLVEILPR